MPLSSTHSVCVELGGQFRRELPADGMGDGDAAGRRDLLEADDEADRRAESVLALDEDVGERDPEPGAMIGSPARGLVEFRHRGLEGDRPFDRVLDARELDQRAVAHRLEQIAGMLVDASA